MADSDFNGPCMGVDKEGKETEYTIVKKLGKGSFGEVFLVQVPSTKQYYVMKKIHLLQLSQADIEDAKKEIAFLSRVDFPSIIGYIGSFVKEGFLCIVMEFADGGDLHDKIQNQVQKRMHLPPDSVMYYFAQCCMALQHCHKKKLLHRDIKTQNIFLTKRGEVKIGDFGISRIINTLEKVTTVCGSPYYLSPEMVHGIPYNHKSDIWSLGVCFYEMCTLKHPFVAQTLQMLAFKILEGKYPPLPSAYPPVFTEILEHMLDQNPETRWGAEQLLAHPTVSAAVERVLRHSKAHRLYAEKHKDDEKKIAVSPGVDDPNEDPDWKHGSKIFAKGLKDVVEAKQPTEEKKPTGGITQHKQELRSFLEGALSKDILENILKTIREFKTDSSSEQSTLVESKVLELLGNRKDLLPIIHTLLYLESKQ